MGFSFLEECAHHAASIHGYLRGMHLVLHEFGLVGEGGREGATSWLPMRGTNRGNEIGPQQIVAQRLLSCLQCLTPKTKSFAEDFI